MTILLAFLSLLADPCRLGGLMQDDDRSLALALSDPDRQDICAVEQSAP